MRSLLFAATLLASPALAQQACIDTEITLLADTSLSMTQEQRRIQRDGYIQAFRNGNVISQIAGGACGAIAVQYIEFAETGKIVADWSIVATDEDAEAFASAIERAPATLEPEIGNLTNFSAVMEFAAQEILTNGLEANWRVVDVSSDGVSTAGSSPSFVRDKYTSGPIWEQIAFNGLPITRSSELSEELKAYFENHIVGGPRSFLAEPVAIEGLGEAIIRKLQEEIG